MRRRGGGGDGTRGRVLRVIEKIKIRRPQAFCANYVVSVRGVFDYVTIFRLFFFSFISQETQTKFCFTLTIIII